MSRILTLMAVFILTMSCGTKKTIYVAGRLADCDNKSSEKCLQVKENTEDEWTVLNNDIEGFEPKDGFLQKIEVKINKIKNPSAATSSFNYKFVKLIYEQEVFPEEVKDVPFNLIMDKNHTGKWKVMTMADMDSLAMQPTLLFKDGSVSGNAGCNNYGATYTVNENRITFGLTHATKRYCTNMKIEEAFFNCLTQVKTYKFIGNKLTLYDADNRALLAMDSMPE